MGTDPTREQMRLFFSKYIVADHPVIIPAYVEYRPIAPFAQQIRRPEGIKNIIRLIPIRNLPGSITKT
jgi:hypothetical protein